MSVEREAKLLAPPGFTLPAFADLPGVVVGAPVTVALDAVYYDTADLALARSGITLRYRRGEGEPVWTLKLPAQGSAGTLARTELDFGGRAGSVPPAARDLVRAYLRSRPLERVARLRTTRASVVITDPAGHPVVEVVDDVVRGDTAGNSHGADRGWLHEVEVELADAGPAAQAVLRGAVETLLTAGCRAEPPVPKLVRVLGERAARPADLCPPDLGTAPTAALLMQHSWGAALARLVQHDPGVRLGDDPEDVHQIRVAARRLRSVLRTFTPLLEPSAVARLGGELGWLGREAGRVRDDDVLAQRLGEQADELPAEDAAAAAQLLDRLGRQRAHHLAELLSALRSRRYDDLLRMLADALEAAPIVGSAAEIAAAPARQFALAGARREWRRLTRSVKALAAEPSDQDLHRVRIRAKHCRYALETAALVAGARAARLAAAVAELQTVLGDQHDTVVATAWLRQAAADEPDCALAAGELIARQRAQDVRLRAVWPGVWRAASEGKLPFTR